MNTKDNFFLLNLKVNLLCYVFTEWLVYNHLYRKFSKNLLKARPDIKSPRDYIRARAYCYVSKLIPDCSILIDCAFLFTETPEGHEFWMNVSDRWREFFRSYTNL